MSDNDNFHVFLLYPQGNSIIQAKVAPPSDKGNTTPIVSFIMLERFNAIKLVQNIHGSLATLSKIIRGTQLLTSDAQNTAQALMNQEVCNCQINLLV